MTSVHDRAPALANGYRRIKSRTARATNRALAVVGLAVVGWLGWQVPAQACSPAAPPCVELPLEEATFPANAVAFRLSDQVTPRCEPEIGSLTLSREADGVVVPASVKMLATGEPVFSPDEVLEAGRRYVLRTSGRGWPIPPGPMSPPAPESGPLYKSYAFLTTEVASYPIRAGTLNVLEAGVTDFGYGSATRVAFAKLRLVDTPDTMSFRALRTYEVEISDYRPWLGGGRLRAPGYTSDIYVYAVCPGSASLPPPPCSERQSYPLGRRTVTVTPYILGAPTSFAPLVQAVELSCDELPPEPDPQPVAPPPAPAPETAPVPRPPEAMPSPAPGARATESAAGCSFGAGGQRRNGAGIAGILFVLGLLLRRRVEAVVDPRRGSRAVDSGR
jgi:hypothetical protein